ncbi:ABC-2 type transport system ATP-binding protein [Natranaerovirga hydrolytica]|uniref:ABC-2 type transport system ATP-binding protein n=1 Tax=Natranaerovirga hydrolytica TaxID=680378 RepID=A0A4R1MD13_9FIRM|nr:ABC transporter ATP-binding protein [Natranaerovirga hydrolytica]TCK87919.1 ABC-2 type transport system ATP-binding protein [Natranaerovirga hydrolytica]
MELLKVEAIKKQFKEIKAVDGISFHVQEGEVLGLLGPNGAGKSTTISMISTLLRPDAGDIYYRGKSIVKSPKGIKNELGFIPQEIALYPTLSGMENLQFWGKAYGLRGKELKERIQKVSQIIGIDKRLKDKVEKYSGGMKRRLNIGVALLHQPKIVIMDEPTVGIDPQSRKHILETVKALNKQGMTVIYTSHYMEEVEYLCSRICIMDYGKIIAEGTKEQLTDMIDEKKQVTIKVDQQSQEVIDALNSNQEVDKVEHKEDQIILTVKKHNEALKNIIDCFTHTPSNILSIDIKEPNLEAVFLHLTGRALRD